LARQAHSCGQRLRIVDPHIKAERWEEPAGEQLDPLRLVEVTRTWEQCLEAVLILLDGTGAATVRQFEEGC
jgi:hypothetical protein